MSMVDFSSYEYYYYSPMSAFLWLASFVLIFVKESLSSAIIQFSKKNCKTTEQLTLMAHRLVFTELLPYFLV